MVQHGDSTVYFSRIGDRHLRHPGKLRSTPLLDTSTLTHSNTQHPTPQEAKDKMDLDFLLNRKVPGQADFVYDVQTEFHPSTAPNEWQGLHAVCTVYLLYYILL